MTRTYVCAFAFLTALLFLTGTAFADDPKREPDQPYTLSDKSFVSGGKQIPVKLFEPKAAIGKHPVVVALHGSDGWEQLGAYKFAAQGLINKGFVVVLVRYYSRTDTPDKASDDDRKAFIRWLDGSLEDAKKSATIKDHFNQWVETVGHAADYARKLPNADHKHVGLVGFSLGGYLAVAAAAEPKFKFDALVEMFGGMPADYKDKITQLPNTLIVHGKKDRIVSVDKAYHLNGFITMNMQDVKVEAKLYNCDHAQCYVGTTIPNQKALEGARLDMAEFFDRELRRDVRTSAKAPLPK